MQWLTWYSLVAKLFDCDTNCASRELLLSAMVTLGRSRWFVISGWVEKWSSIDCTLASSRSTARTGRSVPNRRIAGTASRLKVILGLELNAAQHRRYIRYIGGWCELVHTHTHTHTYLRYGAMTHSAGCELVLLDGRLAGVFGRPRQISVCFWLFRCRRRQHQHKHDQTYVSDSAIGRWEGMNIGNMG